jgi:hypothetical protein
MIKKRIGLVAIAIMLFTTTLTGCGSAITPPENDTVNTQEQTNESTEATPLDATSNANTDLDSITIDYSSKDQDSTYDENTATIIKLTDGNSSVNGDGTSISGNKIAITSAGTYIISGELQDGQLVVDTTKVDTVHIVLNNMRITNTSGSAIEIKQSEKVIITLADNSTNTISDGTIYADTGEAEPDAAIYSQDDLTINGTGTLIVNGNYKHGIKTVDDLVITGGEIVITAIEDGLRGKDSVAILDGNIKIDANGDGIKSNNSEEEASGWISIDGGTFDINAGNNGIQAQTGLIISSGTLNIVASEDTLHCNGSIRVVDGSVNLSAGDDGAHANNSLAVIGGTINVLSSFEGLEGADIAISGGSVAIRSSDDGLNAAGGSDGDMQARDTFNGDGSYFISISGGYVYINSDGDGVDSNGDIEISGGTVVVDGSDVNESSAIDINSGNFVVTGGTLIGIGSSQMLVTPTQATQPVVTILYDNTQSAGEVITVTDTDGNALFSMDPAKSYDSVIISSPEFMMDTEYNVLYGGTYIGESIDGTLYTNGTLVDHTSEASFVFNDLLMLISPDGTTTEYVGSKGVRKGSGGH